MKQSLFISLLLLLFSCSNANTEIVAEVNGDNILLSDLSETYSEWRGEWSRKIIGMQIELET